MLTVGTCGTFYIYSVLLYLKVKQLSRNRPFLGEDQGQWRLIDRWDPRARHAGVSWRHHNEKRFRPIRSVGRWRRALTDAASPRASPRQSPWSRSGAVEPRSPLLKAETRVLFFAFPRPTERSRHEAHLGPAAAAHAGGRRPGVLPGLAPSERRRAAGHGGAGLADARRFVGLGGERRRYLWVRTGGRKAFCVLMKCLKKSWVGFRKKEARRIRGVFGLVLRFDVAIC